MKTAQKQKTWQRTKVPGLLRHKGGGYYGRFFVAGKEKFVPHDTDLFEVARVRHAEKKAQLERGRKAAEAVTTGAANMGDLLALQRERLKARRDISEATRTLYLGLCDYVIKTWPELPGLSPEKVTVQAVIDWRNRATTAGTGYRPPGAKKASANTAGTSGGRFNKAVDLVRQMLDIAVDQGALNANVLRRRGIKAKTAPKKPQLPEIAQLEKIFAEIESGSGLGGWGTETADFCRFIAYTGCRKNEAAKIEVGDVKLGLGLLVVRGTKTKAAYREVPLIPAARVLAERLLARRLAKHRKDIGDEAAELSPNASLLAVAEAQRSLDRACKTVGVPRLTHHDLRDAFATACIEAAVDIPTVAAWLGHKDGGKLLLEVYTHHRRAHGTSQAAKVTFGT